MENKLIIRKCIKCGALINVIEDCSCGDNCNITCCGKNMMVLKPNTVEAAVEKHVPTYEVVGSKIVVKVNHVMEDDHYIKFITLVNNDTTITYDVSKSDSATCEFEYIKGSTIYEYCNKHGLWKIDVE